MSFDTFEAAEEAIKEMDDALVEDSCRLKVSLARHQPMLNLIKHSTPWDGLGTLFVLYFSIFSFNFR